MTTPSKRKKSFMDSTPNSTNNSRKCYNWLLPALALVLTVPVRGETPPPAIPFPDIGARATANYQGDALGITATSDGARLRCGFQKLEGHATPQGLWLESTKPGGGKLRLVATALGRADLSTLNNSSHHRHRFCGRQAGPVHTSRPD